MNFADTIGSIGVTILLIAFLFNLLGKLKAESKLYALLNFVGASLSCYASFLINYVPFIILEGTWAVVALIGLLKGLLKKE
jgi:hypothetical protein